MPPLPFSECEWNWNSNMYFQNSWDTDWWHNGVLFLNIIFRCCCIGWMIQIFLRQNSKLAPIKPKDTLRKKCIIGVGQAQWKRDGHFTEAHLLQSTPFLSGRIELTSLPSLSPAHSSPAPPVLHWLAGLIYLIEGNLHRALLVYLYCNLSPPPDVPLSKHGNIHPEIPVQTYQVVATYWHGPWPIEVSGTVTRVLGVGEQTRKRDTDRKTDRRRCQTYAHASWWHRDDLEE